MSATEIPEIQGCQLWAFLHAGQSCKVACKLCFVGERHVVLEDPLAVQELAQRFMNVDVLQNEIRRPQPWRVHTACHHQVVRFSVEGATTQALRQNMCTKIVLRNHASY